MGLAHVRVARQTDRLAEVVAFYESGLGLVRIGEFTGHAGYSGVLLGLPDAGHHLELTHHDEGSPASRPSGDDLLVLYYDTAAEQQAVVERLRGLGVEPVEAENPYWPARGAVTVADPDGWRVVLVPAPFD